MAYVGSYSSFEGDENEDAAVRRLCDEVLRTNQKWLYYLFTYYAKEKEAAIGAGGGATGGASVGPGGTTTATSSSALEPAMTRDNFMDLINDSTLMTNKVIYLRTVNSIWIVQQQTHAAAVASELVLNPSSAVANAKQNVDALMTYRYFLDALRVIAAFYVRDPMIPLPVKLDRLIQFLWLCPGFDRVRVSMGVSAAVQTSAATNAAQVQAALKEQEEAATTA